MSTNLMNSVGNPFARTLPVPQKKQIQPQIQKVDTTREDIKKRLLESFESQGDVIENTKFASEQLASEIENMIYELTGKNSRDKAYREKSKKIMTRLKGARNSQLRISLRKGNMTVLDFCNLSDKQLDDDSYFDKLFNNVNSSSVETKKAMTRPPNLKSIPIKKIDLTTSFGEGVNDYFDSMKSEAVTEETNNQDNNQVTREKTEETEKRNEPRLGIFNEDNSNNPQISENSISLKKNSNTNKNENTEDNNTTIKPTKEIDTNSAKNLPVLEDHKQVLYEIDKLSPKHNGKSIQFNPVSKNDNINVTLNQTYDHVGSRPNFVNEKEKEIEITNLNVEKVGKAYNKLEELKGLMQKHKQNQKNLSRNLTNQSFNSNNIPSYSNEVASFDEPKFNVKHQELNPVKIIQKEAEPERSIPSINVQREEVSAPVKNEAKNFNVENLNVLKKNIIEETKEQEKEVKNQITIPPIKEIQTETISIAKHQPQHNFYDEVEKEFNYNKATEDLTETKSITENLREKLNARYISPKNETRSNYTNSRLRNYLGNMESKEPSISSFRDRYKAFGESKASLETNLELANKKCDIYEKEITQLRQLVNEMKLQMSRTNEEAHKLEISRLKQTLTMREKESQLLSRENQALKKQVKKYEENTNQLIQDNKLFRIEAEKKFANYNKEIENLINKINELTTSKTNDKESERKEERTNIEFEIKENQVHQPKNETNVVYNHFKNDYGNKINFPLNLNPSNSVKINEQKVEDEVNEIININPDLHPVAQYDNYDHNAFTNGNPNIIEEVGADNYLNMNGNTYDEMKDVRFEDDNLQDHQYYDNSLNMPRSINANNNYNQGFNLIESEIQTFNKNANTEDNFNSSNVLIRKSSDHNKAESGATNNIFNQPEEEKEEEENVLSNKNNIFDSINNSLNIEKQNPVTHSKKNFIMNHSSTKQNDNLTPNAFFENQLPVKNFNKPSVVSSNLPSKNENKTFIPSRPVKPMVKPLQNRIENENRLDYLYDNQTYENAETAFFNSEPVKKVTPTNSINKHQHINLNDFGHMNANNKKMILNDNPFDNFNNEENIWETISSRENNNNIFD